MYRPVEVVSVVDRVHAVLRAQILAGELEPGARLHQEGISSRLGVSRTPVREALARLAADGLVEILPNRGARVAAIVVEDMATAYAARCAIEPHAARLAAARRDPAAIRAMRAAIAAQRRAGGKTKAAFRASRAFHVALVEGGANPFLIRFTESIWAGRIGRHVHAHQADPERLAADADEHERIADAVAAGDPEAAERLTRAHIEDALARLLEDLETGAEPALAEARNR